MATSNIQTRNADEKLRNIALIGNVSHQIMGAKLPSNRQIFQVFFYNMRFAKLSAKNSAELAIDAALIFWRQSRIATRRKDKCIDKLLKMHDEWEKLKKRTSNISDAMQGKIDLFQKNLDNLFDISHADAMKLMQNEEDRDFLMMQRMDGRPGAMAGVDQKLAAKEKRSQLRKEQDEKRRSKYLESLNVQQNGKYYT